MQQLYPLELSYDITRNIDSQINKVFEPTDKKLNVEARDFRPTRNVAGIADLRIRE